jgi:hypothetical protein
MRVTDPDIEFQDPASPARPSGSGLSYHKSRNRRRADVVVRPISVGAPGARKATSASVPHNVCAERSLPELLRLSVVNVTMPARRLPKWCRCRRCHTSAWPAAAVVRRPQIRDVVSWSLQAELHSRRQTPLLNRRHMARTRESALRVAA